MMLIPTEAYFFTTDTTGAITGSGFTPDGTIPENAIECTQLQAQKPGAWSVVGGVIVAAPGPTLEQVKAAKVDALTVQCAEKITGGYVSSALGTSHTYPSKPTDQINMMGSVSASLLPNIAADWSTPFWCEDSDGVWAFRMHSASQIQTAGADGKAHVVLCQSTLERLISTVLAATTAEAVDAVVWPSA